MLLRPRRRLANRGGEDRLGAEPDEVFLGVALGHSGAIPQKPLHVLFEEILIPALEMALSSRHLRDVSDDERHISFLCADQLID